MFGDERSVAFIKVPNGGKEDVQGNIIALLDVNGKVVVQYVYDAWGNHAVLDANGNDLTSSSHIGNRNPFRYRGYFYDVETGLYYLQTRYYDPEIGRFLNMDDISYADPEQFHGLNLYAYCGNNPVNYVDPTGHFVLALVLGLVGSFAVGFGISAVSQGVQYGWQNISWGQSVVDGLFSVASTVFSLSGLGFMASLALNVAMGYGQYVVDSAFHGEALTWEGSLFTIATSAVTGAFGGAGATNAKTLARGMSGRAEIGMKALITTINKYGINSAAFKNVMNLYGKAIKASVQSTIRKQFVRGILINAGGLSAQALIQGLMQWIGIL